MNKKQHYKRFFILVALFGLITSSVVYAAEASPFPEITEPVAPINEILPDLPQLVEPEDPKPEEAPDPEEAPEPEQEEKKEDPENEEPSSSISDDEISDNTVSGQNTLDPDLEENAPGSNEDNSGNDNNNSYFVIPDTVNADNYYKYSLSLDTVKLEYLDEIRNEIISINEVLRDEEENQKDIAAKLSGINRNDKTYQKAVLEFLLSFTDSISGNKIKVFTDEISVSVDASAIGEYMNNSLSENELETVSENTPDPDPAETVSDDDIETISDDVVSISKGDIEQLHKDNEQIHEDLKSIFYVGIFGVIFLAMIAAGNLEQIIFKRLRG